ncbi:MAG: hypothetical protein KAJ10_00330 [Thermodesulfovibrionia bacterium]|nr:hypothetical protein [Thermodesulfovibrionia bacterium]
MSNWGGNFYALDESEVCVFCHTPHNPETKYPLWNHYSTDNSIAYQLYTSSSTLDFDKTDFAAGLPSTSASRLCLSCHEGTSNFNNIANPSGTLGKIPTMGGGAWGQSFSAFWGGLGEPEGTRTWIGKLLNQVHPVGFDFADHGDSEIVSLAEAKANGLRFFPGANGSGQYMECPTCHDPHVDYGWIMLAPTGSPTADDRYRPFLRVRNNSSILCLSCHQK